MKEVFVLSISHPKTGIPEIVGITNMRDRVINFLNADDKSVRRVTVYTVNSDDPISAEYSELYEFLEDFKNKWIK